MSNIKAWVISLRLRTLPLALSTIFMGSFIAVDSGTFRWSVLIWASLTTLFLQILSNLANDYGDAVSGADNDEREGPRRALQQGVITLKQMKAAIFTSALLALFSGLTLIFISLKANHLYAFVFFLMGIAAIAAAIRYTVGRNPYGYRGLGDFYVYLFFGLMGVGGTFFLHSGFWDWTVLLPATAVGFFSTGVLNLNNTRDIESDRKSGKKTLPVMMGRRNAALYHLLLLLLGWTSMLVWLFLFETRQGAWLVFLSLPLFIKNIIAIFRYDAPSTKLDPELRNLSLGTLLFVLLYGIGVF
ncbi:1,4-dihydroxy-2-naphthoate polyprenyltransferase [Marinilabilia salmonicolor]|uniref:1,4-dihydroxy-2-naphthoate polyprenyltransferase n=1 Tax=Marinilabilia salmonicolor TaxID=989 RepID=UPI00029B2BFA|nr:1,4-dihydroxy-2-naphthoate polyprenyltransferase [Marinilabilia salmonicolor]